MGLREQIEGAEAGRVTQFVVEEWGDLKLGLKPPTVQRRADLVNRYTDDEGRVNFTEMQFELLAATLVDEDGQYVLDAGSADDQAWLMQRDGDVVWKLVEVALQVAGFRNVVVPGTEDDPDGPKTESPLDAGKGD